MIFRARRSLLAVLAGSALRVALGAAPLAAQQIPSPYRYVESGQSLSLNGGYIFTDRGDLELGPESGPLAGARYSIRLGGPFTAEASLGFFPSTRTVFDTVAVDQPLRRVGDADISLVLLDAALRFNVTGPRTYHGVQPFVLVGGGIAMEVSGDDAAETGIADVARFDFGTRFAGQVGAGVEWFMTRRLALRADVRDVFWKLKTPPAFRRQGTGATGVPEDEWVQNFALSLGLAYHF